MMIWMISVIIVLFIFISEQVMSNSSNSTNCVMSNSGYSSDGVVNKSKDEIFVVFINFKFIFSKFVHDLVSHIINFFISEYGMTKSSNSTNCVMSNSGYSSDSVVDKSKDEVSVVIIDFKSVFYKFVHNFVCHIFNFFITKYGMTNSSNSTNCVMSNS